MPEQLSRTPEYDTADMVLEIVAYDTAEEGKKSADSPEDSRSEIETELNDLYGIHLDLLGATSDTLTPGTLTRSQFGKLIADHVTLRSAVQAAHFQEWSKNPDRATLLRDLNQAAKEDGRAFAEAFTGKQTTFRVDSPTSGAEAISSGPTEGIHDLITPRTPAVPPEANATIVNMIERLTNASTYGNESYAPAYHNLIVEIGNAEENI